MTSKDVYSPYKFVHYIGSLKKIKKGELINPLFMQIDLSNICNLNCSFCWYKIHPLKDYKATDYIPREKVFGLLKELKEMGVKAIEWTGGGSSECHPDFGDIILEAEALGFEQALVTNGTLLGRTQTNYYRLLKNFAWVRFSVDAATKETYCKVKGTDLFDTALKELKFLLGYRKPTNVIGFSFIVCKENYKEIHQAAKLAKRLGCNNIRFSLAYTPKKEKMFEGIWGEVVSQINKTKKEETDNFKVFAFSNRINEVSQKTFSEYCAYHHFVGVIAANGAVYPCCLLKLNHNYNFGNINKQSFKEIWYGKKRKDFIRSIEKGCPFSCWMTEKNKFCKYLMEDNPPHINFV